MACPLCTRRKPKRACPALGREICAFCCGTKRLVEIACPSDCPYLASAREHPPAVITRQQHRDLGLFVRALRDFNERQSQLFLLVADFLASYKPSDFGRVVDEDVRDAVDALASTFETAARGVIYEHRPQSMIADRLVAGLRPLLLEAGRSGGTTFEREAAIVLRRIGETIKELGGLEPDGKQPFLDWVRRVLRERKGGAERQPLSAEPPRLIVP